MRKILEYKIDTYGKGTFNKIEDTLIPDNAASKSRNFITTLDAIELVGGRRIIGAEETGNDPVLGIGKITKIDGNELVVRKIGTHLQYFNLTTRLWVDIKTDMIDGEPLYFDSSNTPAGRQLWMCGQDGLFKIAPSSPLSILDMTSATKNYKGFIKIDKSRMITVGMKEDPTGIRFSKVDRDSNYTSVTKEAITDTATAKKHYTGTLAFKSVSSRNCFGMQFAAVTGTAVAITGINKDAHATITAPGHTVAGNDLVVITGVSGMTEINNVVARVLTVSSGEFVIDLNTTTYTTYTSGGLTGKAEILTDDKNGNLTSDVGGTGTIDYFAGTYVLDFFANTGAQVVAAYLWEDSTSGGLADFSFSATRLAGEGNVLRQDSIGTKTQSVHNFNNTYYTLQDRGSWLVTISADDLTWNNQVYRENIGCPSPRASVITADGILFMNTYDKEDPQLSILRFNQIGDKIIPVSLSDNYDLTNFTFDEDCCMYKQGYWVFISCKEKSTENDVFIIYNTLQKSFDLVDYAANCITELDNKILVGDSTSPNTFELFTGFDDLDYRVEGSWSGKKNNLKTDYLKKWKRLRLTGYIDPEQWYTVTAEYDNEIAVIIGHVKGDESYVDKTKRQLVGEDTIGEKIVGLGDSSQANYYEMEIKVRTPKHKRVRLNYIPMGVGYVSIMEQKFSDIRIKSSKIPRKYKTSNQSGIGAMQIGTNFEIR